MKQSIRQKVILVFQLFIILQLRECNSVSSCTQPFMQYDEVTKKCIQCSSPCATCTGPDESQCLSCRAGYYWNIEDGICLKSCQGGYYQNETNNTCLRCKVRGCKACDINQNCLQCRDQLFYDSVNNICILNDLVCSSSQFFNILTNKCSNQCSEGLKENNQSHLCDEIQSCNSVQLDSQYRANGNIQKVSLLSNDQVLLFVDPCRFVYASINLQISSEIELITQNNFSEREVQKSKLLSQEDMAGCLSDSSITIFDFVQQKYILNFSADFSNQYIVGQHLNANLIVLESPLTKIVNLIFTDRKEAHYLFSKDDSPIQFFSINSSMRLFLFYYASEQRSCLLKTYGTEYIHPFLIGIQLLPEFQLCQSISDESKKFFCFTNSELLVFQIIESENVTVNTNIEDAENVILMNNFNEVEKILSIQGVNHKTQSVYFFEMSNLLIIQERKIGSTPDTLSIFFTNYSTSSAQFMTSFSYVSKIIGEKSLFIIPRPNSNKTYIFTLLEGSLIFSILQESAAIQDLTSQLMNYQSLDISRFNLEEIHLISISNEKLFVFYKRKGENQIQQLSIPLENMNNDNITLHTSESYTQYLNSSNNYISNLQSNKFGSQSSVSWIQSKGGKNQEISSIMMSLPLPKLQTHDMISSHIFEQTNLINSLGQIKDLYYVQSVKSKIYYIQFTDLNSVHKVGLLNSETMVVSGESEISNSNFIMTENDSISLDPSSSYLLVSNIKILYNLQSLEIVSEFVPNSIISRAYFKNNLQILFSDLTNSIWNFDLNSKQMSLVYENEDIINLTFQLSTGQRELLKCNTNLFIIINNRILLPFSLISMTIEGNKTIDLFAFEGRNLNERIVSQTSQIYVFLFDRVLVFDCQLNPIEQLKLDVPNPRLAKEYHSAGLQFILFAIENTLFRFDTTTQFIISKEVDGQSDSSIFIFNFHAQYFGYSNKIFSLSYMSIVHQLWSSNIYLNFQFIPTEKNSLLIGQLSQYNSTESQKLIFNFNNDPLVQYIPSIFKVLIYTEINKDEVVCYFYNESPKKLIKVSILKSLQNEESVEFDGIFTYIKVDSIRNQYIYSSGGALYKFDASQLSPTSQLISTFQAIKRIDLCSNQQLAIILVSNFEIFVINYLTGAVTQIQLRYIDTLGEVEYELQCDNYILFTKTPTLFIYSLDSGLQTSEQAQVKFYLICLNPTIIILIQKGEIGNQLSGIPAIVNKEKSIYGYFGHYGFAIIRIQNQYISIPNFLIKRNISKIYFDYTLNYLIHLNGFTKIILIYNALTGELIQTFFTAGMFSSYPNIFSEDLATLNIIDENNIFYLFKYKEKQNINFQLEYNDIQAFLIDEQRGMIFFQTSFFVQVHNYPGLKFVETIIDLENSAFRISKIFLEIEKNFLVVLRSNNALSIYDLEEVIYEKPTDLLENMIPRYILLNEKLILVYNIRNQQLSLFENSTVKFIISVQTSTSNLLKPGKLIRLSTHRFVYWNQRYFLFGRINFEDKLIQILQERTFNFDIEDLFFDRESFRIYLTDSFSRKLTSIQIYDYDSISIQTQYSTSESSLKNGMIMKNVILFFESNTIFSYNMRTKQMSSILIGNSQVSTLIKLSSIQIDQSQGSFLSYSNSNLGQDLTDSNSLVISNSEKMVYIIDSQDLEILYQTSQDSMVINTFVDFDRQIIFLIGDLGFTSVFSYQLVLLRVISNPCLGNTRIQTDNFFIYAICPTQLLILDKITLSLAYPKIIGKFFRLHAVYETKRKGLFIIEEISRISIVQISKTGQISEIFSKEIKGIFNLAFSKIYSDLFSNMRLVIFGITFFDVIYLDIAITNNSECSYSYQQLSDKIQNDYQQKLFSNQLSATSAQISQYNIEISRFKEIKYINMTNYDSSGIQVRLFSSFGRENSDASWDLSELFSKDVVVDIMKLESVSVRFVNLNSFNLAGNIKKMIINDINIKSNSTITLNYLTELHFEEVNIINYTETSQNPVIIIKSCTNVSIKSLVIENSRFEDFPVILFSNVASIEIQNVIIKNSVIKGLFYANDSGIFNLQDLNIISTSGTSEVDPLIYVTRLTNINIGNVNVNKYTNGILVSINGCGDSTINQLTVVNSQQISIIQSRQFLNTISNTIYSNIVLNVNRIKIQDSNDIRFDIVHDKVTLVGITATNISYQAGQNPISVISSIVNIINIQFQQVNLKQQRFLSSSSESDDPSSLFVMQASGQIGLENVSLNDSSICLLNFKGSDETAFMTLRSFDIKNNECNKSLIIAKQALNLSIHDSEFNGNTSVLDGGVFNFESIQSIIINSSKFTKNSSFQGNGGCIYAINIPNLVIKNSEIQSNVSEKESGGAIFMTISSKYNYQLLSTLDIENSIFSENSAISGKGGSMALESINLVSSTVKFFENKAAIGGAIHYSKLIPEPIKNGSIQKDNEFKQNKAILYGQNIGSIPRSIQFDMESSSSKYEDGKYVLDQVQSGNELALFGVKLFDEEDNPVGFSKIQQFNDNISQFMSSLFLTVSAEYIDSQLKEDLIEIEGNLIAQDIGSGCKFNISLSYRPQEFSGMKISSPIFEGLLDSQGVQFIEEKALSIHFRANFRACEVGEIKKNSLSIITCETCPDGKYSISENDSECQICPPEAELCSGKNITLKSGFWRSSNQSDEIVVCEKNPEACSNSFESKNGCIIGYDGPVCESCSYDSELWGERYSSASGGVCISCKGNTATFLFKWIICMFIIFLQINFSVSKVINAIQVYIVSYYLKLTGFICLNRSVEERKEGQAYKILIDHIQILTAASAFQLQLPNILNIGSNVLGNPSNISSNQLECFLPFKKYEILPLWVVSFIWSISLPLIMILLLILFQQFKRNWKLSYFPSRYNSTIACSIYLHFLPSIVMLMTKCLNCRVIGGISYTQVDLGIQCSDYEYHQKYVILLVIPILFIACAIIPLVLALLIRRQRMSKKSIFETTTLRFLYDPYKEKFYFWDQVKLLMKSVTMITSMLLAESQNTQTRLICGILFIYLVIIQRVSPYRKDIENCMDRLSIKICIFTLLISNISYQNDSLALVILIDLIIIILNGGLIGYLLFKVFFKPIPVHERDRNSLQKVLIHIQKVYPMIQFPMQKPVSFKTLRRLGLIKRSISQIAQMTKSIPSSEHTLVEFESYSSTVSNIDGFKDTFVPCESQTTILNPKNQFQLKKKIQNESSTPTDQSGLMISSKKTQRFKQLKLLGIPTFKQNLKTFFLCSKQDNLF